MNVINGKREAMSIEQLLNNGWDSFDALEKLGIAPPKDGFRPSDKVARIAYAMTLNSDAREFIEWLLDISIRQPLRMPATSLEQVAIASAARGGINGMGEAVLAAIDMGRKLQEANHAADHQVS